MFVLIVAALVLTASLFMMAIASHLKNSWRDASSYFDATIAQESRLRPRLSLRYAKLCACLALTSASIIRTSACASGLIRILFCLRGSLQRCVSLSYRQMTVLLLYFLFFGLILWLWAIKTSPS